MLRPGGDGDGRGESGRSLMAGFVVAFLQVGAAATPAGPAVVLRENIRRSAEAAHTLDKKQ